MNFEYAVQIFEEYLDQQTFYAEKFDLYDPVNYILASDAKRFRPALLLMSHALFAKKPVDVLPAAFALEVFHNFTLIHDDIMDEAEIRRSKPTAHKVFGEHQAILSGDVMMMLSYRYLLKSTKPENISSVIELMNETAIQICEGQSLDMIFEKRYAVDIDDYIEMITGKTAVLLAASLQIGAMLSGASSENQNLLYQFGLNLGIAFQIQDDVLDTFGQQEEVGKRIGGDILQKKKTYLIAQAQKHFSKGDNNHLSSLYHDDHVMSKLDVEWVTTQLEKYKLDQLARDDQNRYYNKAMSFFENVECPNSKFDLEKLALGLFKRNK